MKKTTIALLLICTATFTQQKGSFTDSRDGKTYKTVKIGEQTWFAENLNYDASGSVCYENNSANCEKYGRLYNWETALKVCPKGWHLPSKSKWELLYRDVGASDVSKKLKAKSGWKENRNGTDEFGFSALPGGSGHDLPPDPNMYFSYVGYCGDWWSSSDGSSEGKDNDDFDFAYLRRIMDLDLMNSLIIWYGVDDIERADIETAGLYGLDKSYLLSVRCVLQNEEEKIKEEIMLGVNARKPGLKHIYNEYLKLRPGFSGKVMLKFTVAPSGDIISISIVSSTTGYAEFDNAIKNKVATWKWKATKGGNTTIAIPFNFTE